MSLCSLPAVGEGAGTGRGAGTGPHARSPCHPWASAQRWGAKNTCYHRPHLLLSAKQRYFYDLLRHYTSTAVALHIYYSSKIPECWLRSVLARQRVGEAHGALRASDALPLTWD